MSENKNFLSSTINNIKNKISDIVLENKIESSYKQNNTTFTLYTKDNILSTTLSGRINNNKLIVYGDHKIPKYSVIVNECNKKAYYVLNTSTTEIKTNYNSTYYIRKGTKILLDENVEEANVIKAGKKYFIYKG